MLDENPRKRRKLTSSWDVLPSQLQVQPTLVFTGKDFGIGSRNGQGENAPLLAGAEPSISASDYSRSTSSNIRSKEEGSRTGSPPWRSDDKDGHYMFKLGENLTPRYKILSKMGEGTFGQVLECWDRKSKDLVAIKIVRGLKKYREAAMIEVDVLRAVGKYDRNGTRCVQMREWFDYRNHTCIVFEKLGPSLYDFLRKNKYSPFPIDLVREVGRQLLESVACV